MRQVIVEMTPGKLVRDTLSDDFFEKVEYIEGRSLLRIDLRQLSKIVICDIMMRDGYELKDFPAPKNGKMQILDVLAQQGNKYTVLVKGQSSDPKFKRLFARLTPDVIFGLPYLFNEEKIVFSFTTESKNIKPVLGILSFIGKRQDIHIHEATFGEETPLAILTKKQKDTLIAAKRQGYFDVPRRITSAELASKLGLSKATTVEHLRKAQNRLMSHLLVGY